MNLGIERDSALQSRVYSLVFTCWFLHVLAYISREKICYIYSIKSIHPSVYVIGFFFIFWMPYSSFLENCCFTVRNVCPLFTVQDCNWRWDDFASVLFQSFEFSDHIPLYKNNLFASYQLSNCRVILRVNGTVQIVSMSANTVEFLMMRTSSYVLMWEKMYVSSFLGVGFVGKFQLFPEAASSSNLCCV